MTASALIAELLGAELTFEDLARDIQQAEIAEAALVDHIGVVFVDQQDTHAERLREALYAAQRVREVAERLVSAAKAEADR